MGLCRRSGPAAEWNPKDGTMRPTRVRVETPNEMESDGPGYSANAKGN